MNINKIWKTLCVTLLAPLMIAGCSKQVSESPPQPVATQTVVAEPISYTVQKGDWLIKKFGNDWQKVCTLNQLKDCNLIKPGQKLVLPVGVAPVVASTPVLTTVTTAHAVKAGESLWAIVGQDWPRVCRQNGIRKCNLIHPGQVLQINTTLHAPVYKGEARHE